MNASAVAVVEDFADIVFAYGVSDEFILKYTFKLSYDYTHKIGQ